MIRISDIYPTVQGEGMYAGMPCVLIRLQGCSVGCPWCDTKETWKPLEKFREDSLDDLLDMRDLAEFGEKPLPSWCEADEADVARHARRLAPNVAMAMVTGGEPAEQDLKALTIALNEHGFLATLETSGTADGFFDGVWSWVCLSPKLGMPGGKEVLDDAIRRADEIKLVISDREGLDKHRAWVNARRNLLKPGAVISLQPESANAAATKLCIGAAIKEGFRLSIQTHKFIGVR